MRILILLVVLLIAGCPADKPAGGIKELVDRSLIIDVRTAQEFSEGHIEGALNIPHNEIGNRITEVAPDKDQSIVLYCRSGRRSGMALGTLKGMGYTQVENAGGYTSLKKELGQ